ncbi:PREDICTED: serine/threonine-protein kinase BLUS1-like isoform X3 [Ipomoea nil]|uniref:serine/threonine-protein kinase BLUS1-like isoform X3 n=1 Tax=Ipomoea nil TaxID=35883 RepID=UPI000900F82A|nr:PREDICTED: serine/threonine-protein kinase BLUS1-like isoform X3 [Ipomoea nil]
MASGQKSYSLNPDDYKLLEEVGYGASATVYRAIYLPLNDVIAVKCLDLDRCNSNLDDIRREAQTMSLIHHPNVIRAFCSFVVGSYLWVVMPFMAEGSCLHLMKIAYPEGFEESAICSILKETLKALEYLHRHGHIHRDVKAGNILLDSNGEVKLADFGVSACMFDTGERQRSRNTFVGTPCWMAPEVLQPGTGYDFKADIWSFGITALELAHGHAPFSKYPPMKVLLMTIQNAPPGLDYDRDKRFSKAFKEMVAMCLVKDQTKRPTAEKLLKHSFFKNVKPPELSVKKLFSDLPPLWNRVKDLQVRDAAQLALKKMPSAEQEAISQSEYQRGVSAWNFDLEDLKFQASMVPDEDEVQEVKEEDENMKHYTNSEVISNSRENVAGLSTNQNIVSRTETENQQVERAQQVRRAPSFSGPLMLPNRASANSLSAPIKPSSGFRDSLEDKSKTNLVQIKGRFSVTSENVDLVKDIPLCTVPRRYSQTSPLRKSASVGEWVLENKQMPSNQSAKEVLHGNVPASILMPHLQNLFQQTSIQQDLIMSLLNSMQPSTGEASQNGKSPPQQRNSENNGTVETAASERERLLLVKISELQTRMVNLTDELTAEKLKYMQLQQRLNAMSNRGEDGDRREVDS